MGVFRIGNKNIILCDMISGPKKQKDKKLTKVTSDPTLPVNLKKKLSGKGLNLKTPEATATRKLAPKQHNLKNKNKNQHPKQKKQIPGKKIIDQRLHLSPTDKQSKQNQLVDGDVHRIQAQKINAQSNPENNNLCIKNHHQSHHYQGIGKTQQGIKNSGELNKSTKMKRAMSPHMRLALKHEDKTSEMPGQLQRFSSEKNNYFMLQQKRKVPKKKTNNFHNMYSGQGGVLNRKNSEQINTESAPKPVRYSKFAFRSEKYIQLTSQLQQQEQQNHQTDLQQTETEQQQSIIASRLMLPNPNCKKIHKEIQYYKEMINRSEKVLGLMNQLLTEEEVKLIDQKNIYKEEIKDLKEKVNEKRTNQNLGHIFSYKDFDITKLIPSDIIIEKADCDISEINFNDFSCIKKKGQAILQHYQKLLQSNQNTQQEDCLSINSKQ